MIPLNLMICLVFTGIITSPDSFSQDVTDAEIKAALIFKFPTYVRWPDEVLNDKKGDFRCCVLGTDRITRLVARFDGDTSTEKIISVKHLSGIEGIEDCHLLFVSASQEKDLPGILKAIEGKPVLTVGDMKNFAKKGGMINFIRKKDSIRFEINPEAAKQAGLEISSKLLRLADIVENK